MSEQNSYRTRVAVQKQGPATAKRVAPTAQTEKQTRTTYRSPRPVGKMALFGGISLAAYLMVFANEKLVTQTFTLGGWHAAFPVMTAFFFSFIHGAFASNLLSVLGLEPKK